MDVRLEKTIKKKLRKIDPQIQRAFFERFDLFLENQYHPLLKNHSLKGKWRNHRSINITGDWRAIYIQEGNNIVFVDLGTHSQLYR